MGALDEPGGLHGRKLGGVTELRTFHEWEVLLEGSCFCDLWRGACDTRLMTHTMYLLAFDQAAMELHVHALETVIECERLVNLYRSAGTDLSSLVKEAESESGFAVVRFGTVERSNDHQRQLIEEALRDLDWCAQIERLCRLLFRQILPRPAPALAECLAPEPIVCERAQADDLGPPGHLASVSLGGAHAPPVVRQDVPLSTTAAVARARRSAPAA